MAALDIPIFDCIRENIYPIMGYIRDNMAALDNIRMHWIILK
jgi:hypothetical protein